MAENKNSATTLVCESQEALYEKAVKKMNADQLIVQHAFKIENYQVAAAMFDEVGAYLDAQELAERCRRLARETREEQQKCEYRKALEMKERAVTGTDYEKASERLGALGNYADAEQEKLECDRKAAALEKKIKHKWEAVAVLIALLVGGIIAGFTTGFFKYLEGVCYARMDFYEKGIEIFTELGTFLDSEGQLQYCRDKIRENTQKENREALIKAKPGDTVVYGDYKWKVLDRQEDQLRLIVAEVKREDALYQASFHDVQEEVSWENASLREWLNTEILEDSFSETERARLISIPADTSVNSAYGTASGKETQEFLSILSIEEVNSYQEILSTLSGVDYWLRTPGCTQDTAAFVSAGNSVMEYGYPVAQAQLSVRPVILLDCSGLAEEEDS